MSAAATAAGFLYASGRLRRNNDLTKTIEPGAGRVVEVGARKNTAPAARTPGSTEVVHGHMETIGPYRMTIKW